jgi:hypothetical protein
MRSWAPTSLLALAALLATPAAAATGPSAKGAPAPAPAAAREEKPGGAAAEELIQAEKPPFSEGIFPCSQCHQGPGDSKRRELAFHDDVQSAFDHDSEHRWCLDCHMNANRDVLHLANGDALPFTESYRLCGQCHGDKYRDWRVGVHGKRVGMWNGQKTYYLCVNCHNPHSPRFKPLKPEPRPIRPEEMKR